MAGYFDIEPDVLKTKVDEWEKTADKLQQALVLVQKAADHCIHPAGPQDMASKANADAAKSHLMAEWSNLNGVHGYLRNLIDKTRKAHHWYADQDEANKGTFEKHGHSDNPAGTGGMFNKTGGHE